MLIPWTLGHTTSQQSNNAGRCVNMIPALDLYGGKDKFYMLGWPGLRYWHNFGKGAEVRAEHIYNGAFYSLVGNKFYRSSVTVPTTTEIGTVSSSSGPAWIINNSNGQMLVVAGGEGYLYAAGVFGTVADPQFPASVVGAAFLSNYGVVGQSGTAGRIWYSGLNDFSVWEPADYVTAERSPDDTVTVFADHGELLVFGGKTLEFFYDSGELEATFRRRQDAFQEVGIASAMSVASADNVVFFLDHNRQVRMLQGYQTAIISSEPIAKIMSGLSYVADGRGFAFTFEGRIFYGITFKQAGRSFVYNYTDSTKIQKHLWFEVQSNRGLWRGNCLVQDGNTLFVGDHENGNIYQLRADEYQDNGEMLKWIVTTQAIHDAKNGRNIFHDILYLEGESGFYDEPQVMMRYSDDNGHLWSDELWESMGSIGEYEHTAEWHRLGMAEDRIYEFSGTDAAPRTFRPPKLDARMGR